MIVRIVIVSTKRSTSDHSRMTCIRNRPGAKTRQKYEDANEGMYVWYSWTFVEQPWVQMRKNDRPATAYNYKIYQYQHPFRNVPQNLHGLHPKYSAQAVPKCIDKSDLNEICNFAIIGTGYQAVIDEKNTGKAVYTQNSEGNGAGYLYRHLLILALTALCQCEMLALPKSWTPEGKIHSIRIPIHESHSWMPFQRNSRWNRLPTEKLEKIYFGSSHITINENQQSATRTCWNENRSHF